MTKKLSGDFAVALYRVTQDPDVQAVWDKGTIHFETMVHMFGYETRSPDRLAAQLKEFILREAENVEAAERDLARKHFTMADCALLELNHEGKPLLARLVAGDLTAVAEANTLLTEIKKMRAELGLDR